MINDKSRLKMYAEPSFPSMVVVFIIIRVLKTYKLLSRVEQLSSRVAKNDSLCLFL